MDVFNAGLGDDTIIINITCAGDWMATIITRWFANNNKTINTSGNVW
jgi:hypothetical protein